MKPSLARIERFVSEMEASLEPPTDHRRWIRLLDPEYGETDEAAIAAHIAAHPQDSERLHWLQWIRTGVPRARDPVGERSRSADYQLPTEAAPELPATVPVAETKPAASPAPEPMKPEMETESNEVVPGFGRRLHYGPSGFWP
jgi:hypothetical protein